MWYSICSKGNPLKEKEEIMLVRDLLRGYEYYSKIKIIHCQNMIFNGYVIDIPRKYEELKVVSFEPLQNSTIINVIK
jgi:hypothetical protein